VLYNPPVFPRVVLGYALAFPILITLSASTQNNIAVTMSSNAPGLLQVFYGPASGLVGAVTTPLNPSPTARIYRLQLPPGEYYHLRIDPGTAPGRYAIEHIEILEADGTTTQTTVPLTELVPNGQLTVIKRTQNLLIVESSGTDPQLLYSSRSPLRIKPVSPMQVWVVVPFILCWGTLVAGIWVLERAFHPLRPSVQRAMRRISSASAANPRLAVLIVACFGTICATYPVLFFGRSFVAPNNGTSPQLYDEPPFAPGSDFQFEDVRGSDTAAMMYAFVPYSHIQRRALAMGEVPLWNRYSAAGRPLWGQGQTLLMDPLHWLTFVTPNPAVGWDLKFTAHRFVFASGIGMAALAATGAWLPAAMSTAAAPFIGFYAYRLNHGAAFSVTYAPWVLLAIFLLASAGNRRSRARAAILLATAASLVLLASPPKEAIIMLVGLVLAGGTTLLLSDGGWVHRGKRFGAAALAAVGTILLTAPHWLLFLDTLKQSSVPAYKESPFVLMAGLPHAVALFLSPLTPGPVLPGLHLLALVLLFAAITAPMRISSQPTLLGCAAAAAALVAVAFGFVPGWFLSVSVIAQIGHVYDVFITAALVPLLILCAGGFAVLLAAGLGRITVVTLLVGLAGWLLVARVAAIAPMSRLEPWVAILMLGPAAALPWCIAQARLGRSSMLALVASAAVIAVLLVPGGLHLSSGVPALDRLLVQPRLRAPSEPDPPAVHAVHGISSEPERAVGVDWSLVPGNQALYDLEGIGGPDALQVPAYEELVTAGGISRIGSWMTTVKVADIPRVASLLDMLNVDALMARTDSVLPGLTDVPVVGKDRLRVGKRDTAWPRAFFVDGVGTYVDASDLVRHVTAQGKPFAAIQFGDHEAIDGTRGLISPFSTFIPAAHYELTINTTSFVVRAPSPGVAVLGETFLSNDFQATLNDRRVPYFRVNHAFKAVRIPSPGDWRVKFEYRPVRWRLSLVMMAAGTALLGGVALSAGVSRREAPRPDNPLPCAGDDSAQTESVL
jgi:hypothetical protein